jgi:hypothetical protein
MARFDIDFAHPARRPRAAEWIVLALGALALAACAWQYTQLAREQAQLQAALENADRFSRRETRTPTGSPGEIKALAAEVARVNTVAARLSVPWETLFSDLEASSGPQVTLLGFEPEADAGRLRITGEARRFEDITAYLRRLEGTLTFRNVFLASHEVRDRAVTFTLTADWVRAP